VTLIVGGGPSGLYAGYRLGSNASFRNRRIVIVEASDRTGGRVQTLSLKSLGFAMDVGAMRYKKHQAIVSTLIETVFKLDSYAHSYPILSYFLRGRHLLPGLPLREYDPAASKGKRFPQQRRYRLKDSRSPDDVLIDSLLDQLADVEIQQPPSHGDQELLDLFHVSKHLTDKLKTLRKRRGRSAAAFTKFSFAEWQTIRALGHATNYPLHETGIWDLALRRLNSESIAYAKDGEGYQSVLGSWNAAEHLPHMLYEAEMARRTDSVHHSVIGGMERVTDRLRDAFTSGDVPSIVEIQRRLG
jgi:phytoene dehydrogenase-like protein